MNSGREMGDLSKGRIGSVEANDVFKNVPMTRFTPGKRTYYQESWHPKT